MTAVFAAFRGQLSIQIFKYYLIYAPVYASTLQVQHLRGTTLVKFSSLHGLGCQVNLRVESDIHNNSSYMMTIPCITRSSGAGGYHGTSPSALPTSPQDVYARLLSSPRGYTLWTPEPSNELLVERRDGLRIGDVGVVIPDDGGFDVFFNICLPPDYPFHRRHGVPEGFTFINPSDLGIKTIPTAEYP